MFILLVTQIVILSSRTHCSVGILLWELVSGTKAFIGAPHNGIVMAVTGGCRPIVPSYCPISLSRLINDCWQDSYRDRPTFKTISARLREMLQNKTSLLTSPGTFSHPTSISLSATTSQDSNTKTQVQTDGVPRLEEVPSVDDATMEVKTPKTRTPVLTQLLCVSLKVKEIGCAQEGGSGQFPT